MDDRDDSLAVLDRGVALINRLLGLALPRPTRDASPAADDGTPTAAAVEARYAALMVAMLGSPDAATVDREGASMASFVPPSLSDDEIAGCVRRLGEMDDRRLVETAFETVSIRPIGLDEVFRPGGYVYGKINHGYWERITLRGLDRMGEPYVRPINRLIDPKSMFDEFLVLTLAAQMRRRRAPPGCFMTDACSLGLGFNNGNRASTPESYPEPLTPPVRAAMTGCLAFLETQFQARRFQVSDGAFPKQLIFDGTITAFAERIVAASDAVVVVGPPHLARTRLRGFQGTTYAISVPPWSIHPMWPAVLGYVLGRLSDIAGRHARVTVLVQAAAASAPLASLVDLMRADLEDCEIHFIDMGQALDVATLTEVPVGRWVRQPKVTAATAGRTMPLYLEKEP